MLLNHLFVDGNKRTGFLAMASLLKEEGYLLNASQEDAYNITIQISIGDIKFEQIVAWLKHNAIKL